MASGATSSMDGSAIPAQGERALRQWMGWLNVVVAAVIMLASCLAERRGSD